MLRTGNDLELQFLSESDFGSVITVEGNVLEDGEEAALQLCIPLVRRIGRVTRPAAALGGDGVVHGEQKGQLLRRGRHDEILSKKLVASLVNIGETGEKILAVVGSGPFAEDDVDEFIDARRSGTGRIRGRNNVIDHRDDHVVLIGTQGAQRVSGSGMGIAEEAKKISA